MQHAIKTYWEVEVYLHAFLTSEVNGELHAHAVTPRQTLCKRLDGNQNRSGRGGEDQKSLSLLEVEPWSSSPWPSYYID
jgi:hypothetical protein